MKEKTIHSRRIFSGRLLKLDLLEVARADGLRARREVVRHPGAVAIWVRAADGRFVFVRQYRKALESHLLEIVAGTREPGEAARRSALREVREETGYAVQRLLSLGHLHAAPGFCDERLDLFFAQLSAGKSRARPDADEALEVVFLSRQQFEQQLAAGQIHDAKTLAAWALMQARHIDPPPR